MADSAESALELLKGQLPDGILMDHMMPGMNGFEALEVIREDPRTAHIPIIMCTSHEDADFVATARKKGVFGILPKSTAPELLPEIMDRLRTSVAGAAERAPAAAGAPSVEAIAEAVEAQLKAKLSKMLAPTIEALHRDLKETLLKESQQFIEDRFASEQAARRKAPPTPTMADLQAVSTRLATETLPDLIKRAIESERGHLMESLEKRLQGARASASNATPPQDGHPDASEESFSKVVAMARREAQQRVASALAATQEAIQAVERSSRSALTPVYLLILGSAVLGVGAAGLVYFLLQSG